MQVRITGPGEHKFEIGQILDNPDCYWCIKLGYAEGVDDEAKAIQAEHEAFLSKRQKAESRKLEQKQIEQQREAAAAEQQRLAEFGNQLMEGT